MRGRIDGPLVALLSGAKRLRGGHEEYLAELKTAVEGRLRPALDRGAAAAGR